MYYVIQQQYDPKEETFHPYTMSIIERNMWRDKTAGYETLEEAKKVLEKVENNYEIEIKASS